MTTPRRSIILLEMKMTKMHCHYYPHAWPVILSVPFQDKNLQTTFIQDVWRNANTRCHTNAEYCLLSFLTRTITTTTMTTITMIMMSSNCRLNRGLLSRLPIWVESLGFPTPNNNDEDGEGEDFVLPTRSELVKNDIIGIWNTRIMGNTFYVNYNAWMTLG